MKFPPSLRLRGSLLGVAACVIAACGSGGGSMGSNSSVTPQSCTGGCGGAVLTLTDAAGDFDSYIVKIVSLQLTRADGTLVETLPVTTQVDFTQLVNLSEVVSATQVPAGKYVSAAMTLDYAGATLVVDNGTTGVPIAAANIIDGSTNLPLNAPNTTQITLQLALANNEPLVVTPGSIANLALDFNLAASNTVGPAAMAPATVTVNPVLTGSLVPDAAKQLRVRGPLVSVNTGTAPTGYVVSVRPFDNVSGNGGSVTVLTTDTTTFTIDGTPAVGASGLAQLGLVATGTIVAAYGSLDVTTQTFTATTVTAGSSVAGTQLDNVQGTVLARSGDALTIANGLLMHHDQDAMNFAATVTATVGAATAVSARGATGSFTIQDISVGQHVQLAGTLGTDSSGNTTLDATAGSAQLLPTTVAGTVVSTANNVVTLNLDSLDGRKPAGFVFAGTGTGTATDAVATAYTVALPAALAPTSVAAGAPVRFTGFVSPFGMAPPDFTAISLVSYANTQARLEVSWLVPGETSAFSSLATSGIVIGQTALAASVEHELRIGFEAVDTSTLTGGVHLVADGAAANPVYAIGHAKRWTIDSYASFGDFETALSTALTGTVGVVRVDAHGPYAAATATLSSDQLIVILDD